MDLLQLMLDAEVDMNTSQQNLTMTDEDQVVIDKDTDSPPAGSVVKQRLTIEVRQQIFNTLILNKLYV